MYSATGLGDSVRGFVVGGDISPNGNINVIQYITIASTGDASDFGDMTEPKRSTYACASPTRGIIAGGYNHPLNVKIIEKCYYGINR